MTPVEPTTLHDGARLVIFAKDQPEYTPLPASVDADGVVMTEWEPTADELAALFTGGRVRIWAHTLNKTPEDWRRRPLQPVRVEVAAPECGRRES